MRRNEMKCKKCSGMPEMPGNAKETQRAVVKWPEMQRKCKKYQNCRELAKAIQKCKGMERNTRSVKKYTEIIENAMETHRVAMGNKDLPELI